MGDAAVVGGFAGFREKTSGSFAIASMIGYAFTAGSLAWTGSICACTQRHIFCFTVGRHLFCFLSCRWVRIRNSKMS